MDDNALHPPSDVASSATLSPNSTSSRIFPPERPGSAPPTFTLNLTNLFAFGTSNTSEFFTGTSEDPGAPAPTAATSPSGILANQFDQTSHPTSPHAEADLFFGHSMMSENTIQPSSEEEEFYAPSLDDGKQPTSPIYSRPLPTNPSNAGKSRLQQQFQQYRRCSSNVTSPVSAIPTRRKNSIEMFLSQSPSQALGGEFMKMNFSAEKPKKPALPSKTPLSAPKPTYHAMNEQDLYDLNASPYYPSSNKSPDTEVTPVSSPREDAQAHRNDYNGSRPPVYVPAETHGHFAYYDPNQVAGFEQESFGQAPANGNVQAVPVSMYHPSVPVMQPGTSSDSHQMMMVPTHALMPVQWTTVAYDPQQQQQQPPTRLMNGNGANTNTGVMETRRGNSNSSSSVKMCRFFGQGHCRLGSKCKFSHGNSSNNQYDNAHRQSGGHGNRGYGASDSYQQAYENSHSNRGNDRTGRRGSNNHRQHGNDDRASSNNSPSNSISSAVSAGHEQSIDSQFPPLTTETLTGRVFSMSKDQNGCRLLQEQLGLAGVSRNVELCELIFEESLDHLPEMMVDPFGNYLFQKLLEQVAPYQRTIVLQRVKSSLVPAALNLHGTRSVQKVVEVCNSPEQLELIVEALRHDAVRLCIDSNGNHVIQRALQHMSSENNQFVFDAVSKECTTIGTHRHGCCVLQRCLDAANDQQKAAVIQQVERHAMKLMQDPYGNYVVQYVLDSCTSAEAAGVILKPLGHVFELSIQKFSSNVIEKCLEKAAPRVKQEYLYEIMNCAKLNRMLHDQFANYVVQRALSVCTDEYGMQLVNAIRPHLPGMKNTSGGRRITARILKRFPNIHLDIDGPIPQQQPNFAMFSPGLSTGAPGFTGGTGSSESSANLDFHAPTTSGVPGYHQEHSSMNFDPSSMLSPGARK